MMAFRLIKKFTSGINPKPTIRLKLLLSVIFGLVFQLSSAQKKEIIFPPPVLGMEYPDFINACDLLSHKKQLVYTRFVYSGVDEYWGATPEKKCNNNINAYLDIPDSVTIRPEIDKKFEDVHNNYWKKYLVIDVIGTFENDKKGGYGHLGSNNSRFIVKYVVDAFEYSKK